MNTPYQSRSKSVQVKGDEAGTNTSSANTANG